MLFDQKIESTFHVKHADLAGGHSLSFLRIEETAAGFHGEKESDEFHRRPEAHLRLNKLSVYQQRMSLRDPSLLPLPERCPICDTPRADRTKSWTIANFDDPNETIVIYYPCEISRANHQLRSKALLRERRYITLWNGSQRKKTVVPDDGECTVCHVNPFDRRLEPRTRPKDRAPVIHHVT
jgi:hypothetical protein